MIHEKKVVETKDKKRGKEEEEKKKLPNPKSTESLNSLTEPQQ